MFRETNRRGAAPRLGRKQQQMALCTNFGKMTKEHVVLLYFFKFNYWQPNNTRDSESQ